MGGNNGRRQPLPSFQFYPSDWLLSWGVQRMSYHEQGIYLAMLSHAWLQGGSLPNDRPALAECLKLPLGEFEAMMDGALGACWEVSEDRLVNHRMLRELETVDKFRDERSRSGKRGAKARWKGHKGRENSTEGAENGENGSAIADLKLANGSKCLPSHPIPSHKETSPNGEVVANAPAKPPASARPRRARRTKAEMDAARESGAESWARAAEAGLSQIALAGHQVSSEVRAAVEAFARQRGRLTPDKAPWLPAYWLKRLESTGRRNCSGSLEALQGACEQAAAEGWQDFYGEDHVPKSGPRAVNGRKRNFGFEEEIDLESIVHRPGPGNGPPTEAQA